MQSSKTWKCLNDVKNHKESPRVIPRSDNLAGTGVNTIISTGFFFQCVIVWGSGCAHLQEPSERLVAVGGYKLSRTDESSTTKFENIPTAGGSVPRRWAMSSLPPPYATPCGDFQLPLPQTQPEYGSSITYSMSQYFHWAELSGSRPSTNASHVHVSPSVKLPRSIQQCQPTCSISTSVT